MTSIEDYVARIVAEAPPLSDAQKDVLRSGLLPTTAEREEAKRRQRNGEQ